MPSKSMYPTLLVGDRVFADKLHRTPKRGDVILFKYPLDQSADYIKRVIGLAGDVVEISHGTVRVNGVELPREVVQKNCPKGPDGITIFENAIPCVLWSWESARCNESSCRLVPFSSSATTATTARTPAFGAPSGSRASRGQ
jgi:signal peptidase I